MAQKLTFLSLPFVVIRLIFDRLHRKDIGTFRLVSRTCRNLSESLIFRTLLMHDENLSSSEALMPRFLSRLCDPEDTPRDIVNHIQIGPFQDNDSCPTTEVLVKVLDNLRRLRDFTWHIRFAVPEEVLFTLSTKHPGACLHIINKERNQGSDSYIPPDTKALSSPQLCSLDYSAYGEPKKLLDGESVFFSEFSTIKTALIQAKNLKRLTFEVRESGALKQGFWTKGARNFGFKDGDRFPALEDLRLRYNRYELTEEHCQRWTDVMDWNKLRHLELEHEDPEYLLVALTGKVRRLKSLKLGFGVRGRTSRGLFWRHRDLDGFKAFWDSIEVLEEIAVKGPDPENWEKVTKSLLTKHGHSLKSLHFSYTSPVVVRGWKVSDVRTLMELCPVIEDLEVPLNTVLDTAGDWEEMDWESPEFAVFQSGSLFINEEAAEQRATQLWEQLVTSRANSIIESVIVTFETIYQAKTRTFTVNTLSYSEKKFDVAKEATGHAKWVG